MNYALKLIGAHTYVLDNTMSTRLQPVKSSTSITFQSICLLTETRLLTENRLQTATTV